MPSERIGPSTSLPYATSAPRSECRNKAAESLTQPLTATARRVSRRRNGFGVWANSCDVLGPLYRKRVYWGGCVEIRRALLGTKIQRGGWVGAVVIEQHFSYTAARATWGMALTYSYCRTDGFLRTTLMRRSRIGSVISWNRDSQGWTVGGCGNVSTAHR